jgi:predicted secreted protein
MAAKKAIGTLLQVGDGASPEVFTTIGGLSSITGPNFTSNSIDVTSHDTTGGFREKITGLKDAGQISGTLFFDCSLSQHQALLDDYKANTAKNYRLVLATFSPQKYFSFSATPSEVNYTFNVDGAQEAQVTFEISGDATENF